MFQHLKLWKEHAPVGACFGVFHPLFKPPAGTSHLFKRRESSVIQPILATLLIINSYGQGNKPDQDTPSHSAPAYHRDHMHQLSWPCTVLKASNTFLYPTSLPCRVDGTHSRAELGSSQILPSPFLLEGWDCFGAQGQSWKILISSSRG